MVYLCIVGGELNKTSRTWCLHVMWSGVNEEEEECKHDGGGKEFSFNTHDHFILLTASASSCQRGTSSPPPSILITGEKATAAPHTVGSINTSDQQQHLIAYWDTPQWACCPSSSRFLTTRTVRGHVKGSLSENNDHLGLEMLEITWFIISSVLSTL